LGVYDVLEKFAKTSVQWVQIDSSMDDSHQSEMLINSEILH